jgi:hypothetical protein
MARCIEYDAGYDKFMAGEKKIDNADEKALQPLLEALEQ